MTKKQILIVDDDINQHFLLETLLASNGCGVLHAYNGAEALRVIENNDIDLVLLDVEMPDLDGFQTMERLSMQGKLNTFPIIFLSGCGEALLKAKGLDGGAVDYLTKPCDNDELLARIRAALRRFNKVLPEPPRGTSTMKGNIQSMGMAELVQSMALLGKTCTITFFDIDGELIINGGQVQGIRQGSTTGYQAFLRLLLLQRGSFTVMFDYLASTGETETTSVEALLINSVSQADEIIEEIRILASPETSVIPGGHPITIPELQHIAEELPMSLLSLIVEMQGSVKENMDLVRAGLTKDMIVFAKQVEK